MTAVLIGVGVLGGLGLVLGLLLTVANKVFEIPSDPKRDAVRNALPRRKLRRMRICRL